MDRIEKYESKKKTCFSIILRNLKKTRKDGGSEN
jgi:hypothetical protein